MTQQAQQQTAQVAIQKREREPLPFLPRNIDDAWRSAELFARSGLIPESLRGKPSDVLVCILTGAELGIQPMQALREIYVVEGRPYVSSMLKVAMVKQSPECLAWQMVESTDRKATFRTHRKGDTSPTTLTFTIEEADRAGLTGPTRSGKPSNWHKYPALMLRRRCASQLADEVYPDVVRGLHEESELEEGEVQATGPATVRQLRSIPSTSAPPSPVHEEAQEATPPPAPPPADVVDAEAQEHGEPQQEAPPAPSDDPSLAEVLLAEIPDCMTSADVYSVSRRAKALPKGPDRDAVGAAIIARRAEIKGVR